MWTTLVTVIQKGNGDAELDRFLSSVREAGIRVTELEPEEICGLPGDENLRQPFVAWECPAPAEGSQECLASVDSRQECLVLTDIPQVADAVKRAGIALLGLEWKGAEPIFTAPYIAQGLEGIDAAYLRMVYKRFHGEPLVIAETERLCIRELICEEAESFIRLGREAGLVIKGISESRETPEDVDMPEDREAPEEVDKPENGEAKKGTVAAQARREFMKVYIEGQYGLYGYGIWAVTDRESGELLGIAGVEDRETEGEVYLELGYAVKEQWRGQGIAKEACLAIIEYLQQELELKGKIKCFVPKGNIASQMTAQSIGMLQTKEIFDKFYCYERIL